MDDTRFERLCNVLNGNEKRQSLPLPADVRFDRRHRPVWVNSSTWLDGRRRRCLYLDVPMELGQQFEGRRTVNRKRDGTWHNTVSTL